MPNCAVPDYSTFAQPSRLEGAGWSRHLRVVNTDGTQPAAYHELFGNLTLIDQDLAKILSERDGSQELEYLQDILPPAVFRLLRDSYFIVESMEEERELIDQWLKDRRQDIPSGALIGALQITSSNACNFGCTYCFADAADHRNPLREQISDSEKNISFETASQAIDNVLDLARLHGKDGIVVKFLGREPLVNWRVIEALLHRYSQDPIQWAVTTNGTLLTEPMVEALKRFDVHVVVSLDGPAAINDRFRFFKSGDGTYSQVVSKIQLLREASLDFGVSSVLSAATLVDQMYGFIDDVVSWGASEIELNLVMQSDLVQIQGAHRNNNALVDKLVDLYGYASKKISVYGDWVNPFHQIVANHKFRDEQRLYRPLGPSCAASSHQLSVEPTGDIFPCRAMSTHYGNISNLDKVLTSSEYARVAMRTYFNVAYCRGCRIEGFCQGTCLGSSEEASGDIYQPQGEYCDVYRLAAEQLLEKWCEGQ